MNPVRLAWALASLAVITAAFAIWLAAVNPTVEIKTASVGQYQCRAPYDTLLTGESTGGGEELPEARERCDEANKASIQQAGVVGLVSASCVVGAGLALRRDVVGNNE